MKNIFLTALLLASFALAADRVDTFVESSIAIKTVTLIKRSDGGCAVVATASIAKSDGGLTAETILEPVDVAGANRTDCLNIVDVRAPVLFKMNRGF